MSKQTKKDIQTNILYDFYRYCNAQESCYNCEIHNILYGEDFYDGLWFGRDLLDGIS